MNRYKAVLLVSLGVELSAILLSASGTRTQQLAQQLVYHGHPPTETPAATLDPSQFKDNHASFVAYSLAAQIRETLYQEPCYCPCDKQQGHRSLLDCFASRHGAFCHICQQEALFCFAAHKKGKSPADIRKALAKGKAWQVNLEKDVERFYRQMQRAAR